MKYYVGVDIGGTNLKAGVVDETGKIHGEASIPTGASRPQDIVLQDILKAMHEAIDASGISEHDIKAAGLGSPGMIDSEDGIVIYNNNLGWRNFHIGPRISEAFKIPVVLENDADAAALGEVVAGSAKGASSAMIITLGTGVGSGYVIGEKIYRGCEFGHMVIAFGGRKCTCGRSGCFESYASATGLINLTKDAIASNPDSILANVAKSELNGHTVFLADEQGCKIAHGVIDLYISYLACGLMNIINGLHPEVISLGGGIAIQGERLLAPLREKVNAEVYGEVKESPAKIVTCTLGYKAGVIGAAMAARDI